MNRQQAAERARAIKACREDGRCDYPLCKGAIGQCWTEPEMIAELQQPVALVAPHAQAWIRQRWANILRDHPEYEHRST